VPTIEQVYARAGMTAPSTAEIAAAAAAQPAAAADGTTPAAAAGAAGTTPAVAGATPPADAAAGQAKPLTTKAAPKEDLPTGQPASASRIHLEPMLQAERIIESITEEDMAGAEGYWNQFFDRGTGQINLDLALQALPNAKMRSSQAAALAWVMNKLRIDSGGQITGAEIATELRASMPIFGDKKEQLDEKVARRRVAEKGYFREGYGNTKLGAETLARLKQSYGFSLDDEATSAAAPAEAAAATDTAAPVLTKGDIKVDEDDIATTMKETGKTREQVIAALKAKGYQ
jgi:NACalpha-BTF3-like transcription factor